MDSNVLTITVYEIFLELREGYDPLFL